MASCQQHNAPTLQVPASYTSEASILRNLIKGAQEHYTDTAAKADPAAVAAAAKAGAEAPAGDPAVAATIAMYKELQHYFKAAYQRLRALGMDAFFGHKVRSKLMMTQPGIMTATVVAQSGTQPSISAYILTAPYLQCCISCSVRRTHCSCHTSAAAVCAPAAGHQGRRGPGVAGVHVLERGAGGLRHAPL